MVRLKSMLYRALGNVDEFDPFPEGFCYTGIESHCYMITHPGHIITRKNKLHRDNAVREYMEYLQNLNQFTGFMKSRESEELVIFAIEDSIFQGKVQADSDFLPFDSSPVIVTCDFNGKPKKYVETEYGERKQNPERMFSLLRDNGINEVRFGGEMVWRLEKDKKYFLCPSCLWQVAELFHYNGFDVRNISGCVYPQKSAKEEFREAAELFGPMGGAVHQYLNDLIQAGEVMEKLYADAIEIPLTV